MNLHAPSFVFLVTHRFRRLAEDETVPPFIERFLLDEWSPQTPIMGRSPVLFLIGVEKIAGSRGLGTTPPQHIFALTREINRLIDLCTNTGDIHRFLPFLHLNPQIDQSYSPNQVMAL